MADLNEIMRALGRIEANSSNLHKQLADLRDEVRSDSEAARQSRAVIHSRLDAQGVQIAHLETTVAVSGKVDAQLCDEIIGLKDTVQRNQKATEPYIDDMRRMKMIGWGISGLILAAGLTVGAILQWASDLARNAIRNWLG